MKSFKDWFNSLESSAATRARDAAFWGLGPKIASPFGRSTPNPGMIDKLLDDIEKPKKKKKKKDKKDESHARLPDYSFDSFLRKLQQAKQDIDKDIADSEEEEKDMEKRAKDKEKEDEKLSSIKDKKSSNQKPEDKHLDQKDSMDKSSKSN